MLLVRTASHCPPSQGIGVESGGDYEVGVGRAGHDVICCHVCIVAGVSLIANLFLRFCVIKIGGSKRTCTFVFLTRTIGVAVASVYRAALEIVLLVRL